MRYRGFQPRGGSHEAQAIHRISDHRHPGVPVTDLCRTQGTSSATTLEEARGGISLGASRAGVPFAAMRYWETFSSIERSWCAVPVHAVDLSPNLQHLALRVHHVREIARKQPAVTSARSLGNSKRRRDCLDHVIVVGEQHQRLILRKHLESLHGSQTHLTPVGF